MKSQTVENVDVEEDRLSECEIRVLNTLSRRIKKQTGNDVDINHFPLVHNSKEVFSVLKQAGRTDITEILSNQTFLYNGANYTLDIVEDEEPSMTGSEMYVLFKIVESQ